MKAFTLTFPDDYDLATRSYLSNMNLNLDTLMEDFTFNVGWCLDPCAYVVDTKLMTVEFI